ncbi:MAG: hypothetical protein JWO31_205 [Phycisphaerales bacterium]|nr:hypothetical protein [Phycisphaerales bacterium]
MIPSLDTLGYLGLLALGFGFVIFWHELGHFLAAKWAGVRVEQFAVGFAHAVVSWRKGMGFRLGSSQKEYNGRLYQHLGRVPAVSDTAETASDLEKRQAGEALGLGETEYRLNWLPLGGYVKMLGQDDLRPNSEADDPKAYNRQPIYKRMVIVSAGVIMNVILAAIGFVVLFSVGFKVPPAKVGSVVPNSPAQLAGVRVGDRILELDGKTLYDDYTKLQLNAALSASGQDIPIKVERATAGGAKEVLTLTIQPQKSELAGTKLVSLGIGSAVDLRGPKPPEKPVPEDKRDLTKILSKNSLLIQVGDVVTHVNGRPVEAGDLAVLDAAVQSGEPVQLTVRDKAGQVGERTFVPTFDKPFGREQFDLLGMVPRQVVTSVGEDAPAAGKLLPGDVLLSVGTEGSGDAKLVPNLLGLRKLVNDAAGAGKQVKLTVLRAGNTVEVPGVEPKKISRQYYGVGVSLAADPDAAVVSEVLPGSAAAVAGIPDRATVTAVNGKPVANWQAAHVALRAAVTGGQAAAVPLGYKTEGGEEKTATLNLDAAAVALVNQVRYEVANGGSGAGLFLDPTRGERKAGGIGEAIKLGAVETRDFVLQFYVTLKRMATRDVSADNLMGPIGIFQTGTTIASKGPDWLLWFLSMISANLAVVNFLPIPIVDGGLFLFLLIEKVKGRPASPRVQMIAQYVGLALLLSIFLFVTYQDIANFRVRM